MTNHLDGGNLGSSADQKRQEDIWAQELRRADERADKFKNEVEELLKSKRALE
jgi:hypothetical protein